MNTNVSKIEQDFFFTKVTALAYAFEWPYYANEIRAEEIGMKSELHLHTLLRVDNIVVCTRKTQRKNVLIFKTTLSCRHTFRN